MSIAIAIVALAAGSGGVADRPAGEPPVQARATARQRGAARASVTILKPERINFERPTQRGERVRVHRDRHGTTWIEFS